MKRPSATESRRLWIGLAVVFSLSAITFALVAGLLHPSKDTLWFEGAKVLPQIGLVSVAGAVLSYLTSQYQRAQQASDQRRSFLGQVLATVTQAYSDLKRSRRMLRARALHHREGEKLVVVQQYDAYMDEINGVQLKFEQLAQDIASTPRAFTNPESCVAALRAMEAALHRLISEYEEKRPTLSGTSVPLAELPTLSAFLARQSDDPETFDIGFFPITQSLWNLRALVRSDLSRGSDPDIASSGDTEQIVKGLSEWRHRAPHMTGPGEVPRPDDR